MDYDAKTVGQTLQQVPIGDMIKGFAVGIADAQWALDEKSIAMALKLMEKNIKLPDANGVDRMRSLLELGFEPTFYQFQEATIEIAVSLTMKVEQSLSVGAHLGVGMARESGAGDGASPLGALQGAQGLSNLKDKTGEKTGDQEPPEKKTEGEK